MHRIIDICAGGESVTVPFENEKAARGQRSRWYQFLSALKRDANNPPAWADKQAAIDKVRRAMSIEVTQHGEKLIYRNRDASPVSQAYSKMIVEKVDVSLAPIATSEEESLAKLMEKLGKG
jgi:hypothetical protein